jgi:hypothetical protein
VSPAAARAITAQKTNKQGATTTAIVYIMTNPLPHFFNIHLLASGSIE